MDKVGSVVRFNNFVIKNIVEHGTCKLREQTDGRIACFEADCYKPDNSIDGFVGWWEDDHSQMTHADTPYKVYCTMPHES